MAVELSILIPVIRRHESHLEKLLSILNPQLTNECELIVDRTEDLVIGSKRNKLLSMAKGEYIVFIDADDKISPNYVSLILKAIESNTDSIGINGIITTDGCDQRKWFISKQYGRWFTGADGTYYRTPNHISPVKRELALKARFPDISFGEDAVYSNRLLQFLKTEVIISEPLYHYDFYYVK